MTNTVAGKAALLMAAGSSNCATENCVLCGRFTPKADRLPAVAGYAHVECLLSATVAQAESLGLPWVTVDNVACLLATAVRS